MKMEKYIAIRDSYGYRGRYWRKHNGEDNDENHFWLKDGDPKPPKHFKKTDDVKVIEESQKEPELTAEQLLVKEIDSKFTKTQLIERAGALEFEIDESLSKAKIIDFIVGEGKAEEFLKEE